MTKELYLIDTLVSAKYKTFKALPLESRLRLVLYLPLDSHLELYVLLKALPPVCMKYTAEMRVEWQI